MNGIVVGLLREWTAFQLSNVEAVDGRIRVGAILVNPVGAWVLRGRSPRLSLPLPHSPPQLYILVLLCAGEDVVFPAYNCEEMVMAVA